MPQAVIDNTISERFDLKSLKGGWVKLRKMSYGQRLKRQEIAFSMSVEGGEPRNRRRNNDMSIEQMQTAVSEYEFKICIADHNLEDQNGDPLNFGQRIHVRSLLPEVGEEIDELITKYNSFDEDESLQEE